MKNFLKAKSSVLRNLLFVLLFLLISSAGYCEETTFGPGFQVIDWSLVDVNSSSPSGGGQGQMTVLSGGEVLGGESEDEIVELARGLKYDPDLMYRFVHDNIEFTPRNGYGKGAYMTLMDRCGNDFDQASLLIALLKQAESHNGEEGAPYTITSPRYFYGKIRLTFSQTANWLDVPENTIIIERILKNFRTEDLDGTITTYKWSKNNTTRTYTIPYVWVGVTIDGSEYVFDPSMKSHRSITGITLETAMGYNQADFLSRATSDATVTLNYVMNLNKSNIVDDLSTYSSNLITYIRNNEPSAKLEDIIGGKLIIPAPDTILRQTHLAYEDLSFVPENWSEWIDSDPLLDKRRSWLSIRLPGNTNPIKLYSSDIYGKRLTVSYNSSHQPELKLDGTILDTGPAVPTQGKNGTLVISIQYPVYSQGANCTIKAWGFYNIVNGWGYTGKGIVDKHRKILQQKRFDGESDSSEIVLGESFALVGFTWLAEQSRQTQLIASITDSTFIMSNTVGVSGQYTGPYIDLPGCLGDLVTHNNNDPATWAAAWLANGYNASAFESGIIHQLQSYGAVSTIRLLDIANDLDMGGSKCKLYSVTKDNYQTVIPEIRENETYPSLALTEIENYIVSDGNYLCYLPAHGDFGEGCEGCWKGYGYILYRKSTGSSTYAIKGDYNGGYSSGQDQMSVTRVYTNWSPNPVFTSTPRNFPSAKDPINLFTGAYYYDNSDITIGAGGFPQGLGLARHYDSYSRLEGGPFGLGWTHNFDIKTTLYSDGFQSMGDDSPIDAAANIATVYIVFDLLRSSYTNPVNVVTAAIATKWKMDQMIDNVVTVKQGEGSNMFVKLPDGSYNPPPGDASVLAKIGDSYQVMDKTGNTITFNADGNVAQLQDQHNNTVDFTYSDGLLSKVSNSFNYSLNFSYSGNHISSVTAKKGTNAVSTVTYGYDGSELQNYTDAKSKATTFTYDATNDGQLTQVYYPAESGSNLFVTNVYDPLGRVKQQTNANDYTYDYYYSYYRTEEQQPAETPPGETEPQKFSKIYYFDRNGNTIAEVDQLGRETASRFDGQQRKIIVSYPTGNYTQYTYDDNHNVESIIQIPGYGAVAHWSFDEGHGPTAYEPAGGNDGVIHSATWTNGKFGDALSFNGADSNVGITSVSWSAIGTGDFSIQAWVNPSALDSNRRIILADQTLNNFQFNIDSGTTSAKIEMYLGTVLCASSTLSWNLGQWYHIVVTRSGGTVTFYRDGIPVGSTTNTVSVAASASLNIGYRKQASHYPFNGLIDEVLIFNSALSPQEVANLYASTGNIIEKFIYQTHEEAGQWWISQVKTHTVPDGNQVTYEYDYEDAGYGTEFGDLMKVTYPDVEVAGLSGYYSPETQFTYNAYGQVLTKTEKVTDGEETTTKYEYYPVAEGAGLERTIVDCDGLNITARLTYDNVGNIHTAEDPLGNIVTNEYDNMRRLKKTTGPAPFNYETCYEYYPDGELKAVQVETGVPFEPWQQTTYTYTPTGQKYEVTDTLGNITRYEYDSLDRLCKTTDTENHLTKQLYYPDGQLWKAVKVIGLDDDELSETDDIHQVTNTYDVNGLLYSVKDARDNETIYEYDGFARLERTNYADYTYEQLGYDISGNIKEKRTRAGQTISYTYDELNRLKTKTLPTNIITYEYDLANRLINTIDSAGTINSDYDKAGRVTVVTNPDNPDGKVVSYQYDAAGNRERLTYPDSTYVTYQYDELNRLEKILDAGSATIVNYGYDALRRRTASYANGTTAEYDYDIAGRLLSLSNQTNTVDYDFSYTYDKVGNRRTMIANGAQHNYSYDDIYRLTNVDYPAGYFATDTAFSYDKAGNRGMTMGYVSNSLNQYDSVGGTAYDYDDSGNLTNDGTNSYTYDAENRLITAVASGESITYSYDPSGRRIAKDIGGKVTKYIYDGAQMIAEYDGGSKLLRKFVYGTGIDEPIRMTVVEPAADITSDGYVNINDLRAMADAWLTESDNSDFNYNADLSRDGKIDNADVDILSANWLVASPAVVYKAYYYHFDGLGSVVALTDSAGNMVEEYRYDVYGRANTTGSVGNIYFFTGREYDAETGLYYYRARYYSPVIGRFLQTDPIGYEDSMNLYTYCGNNPIILVDPQGLSTTRIYSDVGTVTIVDPSMDEFRSAINSHENGSITKLSITGHGNRNFMNIEEGYGGRGIFWEPQTDQIVMMDNYENFVDFVKPKLAKDAEIVLNGCNTAREGWVGFKTNDGLNISKQLSQQLPNVTVTGNRGVAASNELYGFRFGKETHGVGLKRSYRNSINAFTGNMGNYGSRGRK